MKTISRQTFTGLLMAAIFALGAVAGFAQDPGSTAPAAPDVCKDPALTPASEKVTKDFTDYPKLSDDDKAKAIEHAEAFATKYASCESAKDLVAYVNQYAPGMKKALAEKIERDKKNALLNRFNTALKAKNFDEVYASGKEILQKYGDEFRAVEIVLGSIGYDEAYKGNNKYNDETLKFARQAIADLEAGKTFKTFGVAPGYLYESKEDALGWLNLYVGYLTQTAQKNKSAAAPFLYKATQAASGSAKIANPYGLIGDYYYDELVKLVEKRRVLVEAQSDTDTPEVRQQKIDEIKATEGLVNGMAERTMDAYARAYTLTKAADYKALMKENIQKAYQVRFGKVEGVDAWIAGVKNRPFPNPTTPVAPITDEPGAAPAPVTSTAPTTTTTAPKTTPVNNTTAPSTTAKPATGAKPQAKRAVAKRKRA